MGSKGRGSALTLALMIIVVGLLNTDQNLMNANLVAIRAEFGVSDAAIGIVGLLFTILGAIVSLGSGYLSDKTPRKRIFIFTVLLSEIPCFLTAYSANWGQFFLFRILTGFGVGASFPVVFSMLGDMYDEKRRASAVAWMTTSMGIGQIVGQIVPGFLPATIGWRPPFAWVAVATVVALAVFALVVKEPRRGTAEASMEALAESGFVYPRSIKIRDYLRLFRNRTNLLLFIQGILGTVPWGAIPQFLQEYLQIDKGMTVADSTIVFALFALGNIAGTILGGLTGGALFKKGAARVPHFCAWTTFVGSALTIALFIAVPSGQLGIMVGLGFLAAFFVSMTGPNMRTMLLDVNPPENRGAIFSVFNLTDSVGTGLGKGVCGLMSSGFGLAVGMTASAAFWIPCAAVLWVAAPFFVRDNAALKDSMKRLAQEIKEGKEQARA